MQSAALDVAQLTKDAFAALARGESALARDLLEQVVASGRADVQAWLALAHARAGLHDGAGQAAALEAATKAAPNDLRVLLARGDHLVSEGDARGASAFYSAAMQYMPRFNTLPPALQQGLKRAQEANQRVARELEDHVRSALDQKGLGVGRSSARFDQTVDVLFGRKRVYVQEPRYLYVPGLPQIQFYDPGMFPWIGAAEAAFDDIRAELSAAIGGDFKPYVTQDPSRPQQSQAGLVENPNWSALFLYKDGAEQPWAARCSHTLAALEGVPLTRIPNRAPQVLFSKLAAGAHIPAHTGMLNARLICHLPLIVPQGCEFRVGNELRSWREGKVWVFDDTIEHEAWNRSDQDRYILLFDVWRPELNEDERTAIASLCEAIDAYRGVSSWDA